MQQKQHYKTTHNETHPNTPTNPKHATRSPLEFKSVLNKQNGSAHVFDLLLDHGKTHAVRLFGSRALNALRVEKNFGSWAREYRPVYGPYEAGMGRFVALKKEADFIGKSAAAAEKEHGGKLRLRAFVVEATDADAIGDEPIWFDGEVRGWVTSGGYADASRVSVAMGYVHKEIADEAQGWSLEILGEHRRAQLQSVALFDPAAERMRG